MNWILSLVIGIGVGLFYGLCGVRSPAPPVIALVGLLGMLAGEQAVGYARQHFFPSAEAASAETVQPQD